MAGTVLIVDDERDVVAYLKAVLTENGYRAIFAHDARRGMELAISEKPDVICLDIMMPEESGLSMFRKLKQDKRLKKMPVVIISGMGNGSELDLGEIIPDGSLERPESFLEKPINMERFLAEIKRLIGSKKRSRADR